MQFLSPGCYVRLEGRPDWGLGQIQSVVGSRVTVNFEHAGKQLINMDRAMLVSADDFNRSH
ncbi:MAG: DUF3553 domain-containing protein [Alphaproteobacteria bacterium]|nr:DUF3553 domain-containing protein [Alphaproteobacteria bacterium]